MKISEAFPKQILESDDQTILDGREKKYQIKEVTRTRRSTSTARRNPCIYFENTETRFGPEQDQLDDHQEAEVRRRHR